MPLIDLTGMTFGNLVVLERVENAKSGPLRWKCRCLKCNAEFIAYGNKLRGGKTKACPKCARVKHGWARDRIYPVWQAMIGRCERNGKEHYDCYGGRGISVCPEWHDVSVFAKWAYESGFDPKAPRGECTLDRIDVNKGYSPDNCRWVSMKEQAKNTRANRWIEVDGQVMTLGELSTKCGIDAATIANRLNHGWSIERAICDPVQRRAKGKEIICINDGERYETLGDAARAYGLSYDKLRRVVDTSQELEGYTFRSADFRG